MPVKGQRVFDVQFLHDREADAIRERIAFIFVLDEIGPSFLENLRGDMDKLYQGAMKKPVSNVGGLGVTQFGLEEGYGFVKNE
jgi:hypothetical protein